jgi:hypothetical protein
VVTVPWAGTVGEMSSPLVRSYEGVGAPTSRSPAWWNLVWRSPSVSGMVMPYQVENRGKYCIGKRLCHSYRFLLLLASVFSGDLSLAFTQMLER